MSWDGLRSLSCLAVDTASSRQAASYLNLPPPRQNPKTTPATTNPTIEVVQDVPEQLRQRFRHIVRRPVFPSSFALALTSSSSPQGRIFQIEYAAEAVKQGSVVVGIASKTHAVLCAIKASPHSPAHGQMHKKLFSVDEHAGIAIAGLTSDARVLSNFMKQQCLGHRLTYGRAMPLRSLVDMIGEKAQINTQVYGKRPYGVGLLVAGVDERGPHLFEFQPSGMTEEMVAFAIGARSQMARTYLERNVEEFANCSREELIKHGLKALKESLVQDKELTVENTSVGVVGQKPEGAGIEPFKLYDGYDVKQWIDSVADGQGGGEEAEGEGMEVDS
ncbi:proteasome component C2 [Paramyrothecium foliicola]|nr:proteasome component C2 [Paramyrothecium foliicola]